ncbi:ABC transporter permease [Deferribacter autotrophicus]|uniref:ABC transporter permease n=1 Tax=Deferribacter autotrophicus TaxID=500465 RepID=A0A5A8F5I4_9BACT|nr:FtsX-like permease family protein [Deferribacter autotrophicus]KAA0256889.1 ABC transporter permease [Deferribacter autotrophicus]
MNLLTIPLRNLKRKLLRTILLITVFTFGITSIVTLNNISKVVGKSLEKKLNEFGANIIIYPKTEKLKISYGGFDLGNLSYTVKYLPVKESVEKIKNIELNRNISSIAPKLITLYKINDKHVGVIGIKWSEEKKIKSYWSINGKFPENKNEILIGKNVAKTLNLTLGSIVELKNTKYKISGILNNTGTDDDNVIFMDIDELQKISGLENLANFIEVSALCSGCPIDDIVKQISEKLPNTDIKALQSIVKQRMSAIKFVEKLAYSVSVVILVIACFMIAMFMFASVNERKKEVGLLRSLGYSKFNIFNIFSFEAMLMGSISGICGYILGYLFTFYGLSILKINNVAPEKFNFVEFLLVVIGVIIISTVSASFPALKASKIEPSEALIQL